MNLSFNLSNVSVQLSEQCSRVINGDCEVNAECISRLVCGQMSDYYVRIGILLVVAYILLFWLIYWFFNYGWKRLGLTSVIRKELENPENRMFWIIWILQRVIWAFIIFTVTVVIMNY